MLDYLFKFSCLFLLKKRISIKLGKFDNYNKIKIWGFFLGVNEGKYSIIYIEFTREYFIYWIQWYQDFIIRRGKKNIIVS